jgi:hypothetical protein
MTRPRFPFISIEAAPPNDRRLVACFSTNDGKRRHCERRFSAASNPESAAWTLDCFGAKARLAMTDDCPVPRRPSPIFHHASGRLRTIDALVPPNPNEFDSTQPSVT